MNFIKKQSAGFYVGLLTTALTAAGLVCYLINCQTSYFSNLGVNPTLVICLTGAAALELMLIIGSNISGSRWQLDFLPVVCGILIMAAFAIFISVRVNAIASILSFERNDQTMADLFSAVAGMGFCFGAAMLNIIGSFLKTVKE